MIWVCTRPKCGHEQETARQVVAHCEWCGERMRVLDNRPSALEQMIARHLQQQQNGGDRR